MDTGTAGEKKRTRARREAKRWAAGGAVAWPAGSRRKPTSGAHYVGLAEERVELVRVFRQPATARLPLSEEFFYEVERGANARTAALACSTALSAPFCAP